MVLCSRTSLRDVKTILPPKMCFSGSRVGDGERQGTAAFRAGELPAGGSHRRGYGTSRHLNTQLINAHTYKNNAEEAQLSGTR